MRAKPSFLGPEFGSQFGDSSVAQAYWARPAYAPAAFPFLAGLRVGTGPVLELGSGTGHLTLGLAQHVDQVVAVEPSSAMLAIARRLLSEHPVGGIEWHHCSAEEFAFDSEYSMVVAAESLHWMEWSVVLPQIWKSLSEGGCLAIVGRQRTFPDALRAGMQSLVPEFSTNRHYTPYDLVEELTSRALFEESGRRLFNTEVVLSGERIVEWYHSQNGFSRERMSPERSRAFDAAVLELIDRHHPNNEVQVGMVTKVIWGTGQA